MYITILFCAFSFKLVMLSLILQDEYCKRMQTAAWHANKEKMNRPALAFARKKSNDLGKGSVQHVRFQQFEILL